jgi:hypothetical protein
MILSDSQKINLVEYKGFLKYETIGEIIQKLQQEARKQQVKMSVYKRVLTATIESLENIYRYNDSFETEFVNSKKYKPEFSIILDNNVFVIRASNPVHKADIEGIKNKLDYINVLDSNGLKKLYKSTISNGKFSLKGGAGLGMIEMAKTTGGKVFYEFESINDNFSFFSLQLNIVNEI